jgi:hypothetical protein
MEARSQLRHRPTFEKIYSNSHAGITVSQTALERLLCVTVQVPPDWNASCETCQNEYAESEDMKMTTAIPAAILCSWVALAGTANSQTPSNTQPAAPVSYSSISELNDLMGNLQQASASLQEDLSRLRIEKWKADSGTKRQTQNDSESILRNLQNALPGMLQDLKNSPENLALTFKVYRNLDALYDVGNSVTESAGAFGSKEEFQSLNRDLGGLENSRRAFAERMDKLAAAKENEIGQLRAELQNARAAIPPKKVVVDDTEPTPPPKKTPAKKKSAPKPPASTQPGQSPASKAQ